MSPKCQNCSRHVSSDFARVFGNNDNEVLQCNKCAGDKGEGAISHLMAGGGGKEEYDVNKYTSAGMNL